MEVTESQGLPYPEPDDFANGSLQLKILAEAIDAKLEVLDDGYQAVLERPVVIRRVNGGQTVTATVNSVVQIPTTVYESSVYLPQGTTTLISFNSYPAGIYMAGGYLATNPTGAVNANTRKVVSLVVTDRRIQPGIGSDLYEEIWYHGGTQTNTGGDFITFTESFEIHDPENAYIYLRLEHNNTSSTLGIGGGNLWFVYIGELAS